MLALHANHSKLTSFFLLYYLAYTDWTYKYCKRLSRERAAPVPCFGGRRQNGEMLRPRDEQGDTSLSRALGRRVLRGHAPVARRVRDGRPRLDGARVGHSHAHVRSHARRAQQHRAQRRSTRSRGKSMQQKTRQVIFNECL